MADLFLDIGATNCRAWYSGDAEYFYRGPADTYRQFIGRAAAITWPAPVPPADLQIPAFPDSVAHAAGVDPQGVVTVVVTPGTGLGVAAIYPSGVVLNAQAGDIPVASAFRNAGHAFAARNVVANMEDFAKFCLDLCYMFVAHRFIINGPVKDKIDIEGMQVLFDKRRLDGVGHRGRIAVERTDCDPILAGLPALYCGNRTWLR